MKKIVLFNGPPRCGKDTSCLAEESAIRSKFAKFVKEGAHAAFGLDINEYHMDYFEDVKDTPLEVFHGKTPREVYIYFSESFMKPLTGDEGYFGTRLSEWIDAQDDDLFFVTDSGFREEAEKVVFTFGSDNVFLVRIKRPNCNFSSDSRSYIDLSDLGVISYDIDNNSTQEEFIDKIKNITKEVMGN